MKKLIIGLSTLLLSLTLNSQSLVVEGANWYHNYIGYGVSGGYVHMIYEQDTILNDSLAHECKTYVTASIMGEPEESFPSGYAEYFYTNEDQVYRWIRDHFVLFYDLSASVGDSLAVQSVLQGDNSGFCDEYGFSRVDSVGVVMIDGLELRYIYISDIEGSNTFFNGYIYERIGSVQGFPWANDLEGCISDGQSTGVIRCYEDPTISYHNPNFNNECDFVTLGIDENELEILPVHPNPSNGIFQIRLPNKNLSDIVVYDLYGKVVVQKSGIIGTDFLLDLSFRSDGIYMIELQTESGKRYYAKVIKR